jgi:arylsulfatase A-like enzyme
VPLLIVDPRTPGVGNCPYTVRSIDLAPTLLELAGIDVPGYMDGRSLWAYLRKESYDLNLPAFNETGIWLTDMPRMPSTHLRYPGILDLLEVPIKQSGTLAIKKEYREIVISAKDRMVRIGDWKLIYQPTGDGPLCELFNLKSDPECRCNVAVSHLHIVKDLRECLESWIEGTAFHRSEVARPELLNA